MTAGQELAFRSSASSPQFLLSSDGYLRMTLTAFSAVPLCHLLTQLHEHQHQKAGSSDCLTEISGYTEWVSRTLPVISVSWDWTLGAVHGKALCRREGPPFSNIMLVDAQSQDLGADRTAAALGNVIDTHSWQAVALTALNQIYRGGPCQI